MVDTVRSLVDLQALLADNTVGAISPQDVRDFLVSVFPGVVGNSSAAVKNKTADQDNTTTSGANITDLTVPLAANEIMHFHAYLMCSAVGTTTGIQLAIQGPGVAADVGATIISWTSATALSTAAVIGYESYTANTASQGAVRRIYEIYGVVRNGATPGTFALRLRSEVGGNFVRVHQGSWIQYFLSS